MSMNLPLDLKLTSSATLPSLPLEGKTLEKTMEFLICNVLVGAGATAGMDIWMIARKKLFGIPPPDYGLVGRWIAYLAAGRFRHDRISATPAARGERTIGWITHYLVGIT